MQIVPADKAHLEPLNRNMRQTDRDDLATAPSVEPRTVLAFSLGFSDEAWTLLDAEGVPVAMWGVAPFLNAEGIGYPWLIGTEALKAHEGYLSGCLPDYIRRMHKRYPLLLAYADANSQGKEWLLWSGFTVLDMGLKHGPESRPVYQCTRYEVIANV